MDPVRISQTVKKNMLKENAMYQKQEESIIQNNDVNLTSKDMEVNFSNKQDDEDELEGKPVTDAMGGLGSDKDFMKPGNDTIDDEPDLYGAIPG